MQNKCFTCDTIVREHALLKGAFICPNQRCIRFGLFSQIYIAPELPQVAKPDKKVDTTTKEKDNGKSVSTTGK